MNPFEQIWRAFHADAWPVGWGMRRTDANWVRFHFLPDSKRFAETAAEEAIVIARSNTLATEVLGEGAPCWLAQAVWAGADTSTAEFSVLREFKLEAAFDFREDETDPDSSFTVHAGPATWRSGGFDALLKAIAEDRVDHTIWMSARTGAVFAPYDGGVDLFLPTADGVSNIRARHRSWLSKHPLGL